MGGLANIARVGFLKNDAAPIVGNGALQGSSRRRAAHAVGRTLRQAEAEKPGEVEVVLNDFSSQPTIRTGERFQGGVECVTFFNGDCGFLRHGGCDGDQGDEQTGGGLAKGRNHGGFLQRVEGLTSQERNRRPKGKLPRFWSERAWRLASSKARRTFGVEGLPSISM